MYLKSTIYSKYTKMFLKIIKTETLITSPSICLLVNLKERSQSHLPTNTNPRPVDQKYIKNTFSR